MISRKIGATLIATLALGALVASPASATEGVLQSEGTGVAAGTSLAGSSVGAVKFTSGGNTLFECGSASLGGVVSSNTSERVNVNVESAKLPATGTCPSSLVGNLTITFETPLCLMHTAGVSKWFLRGNLCTKEATRTAFVMNTASLGSCTYMKTSTTEFTGTVNSSPLLITPTNASFTKSSGAAGCWASLKMEGTFELKTAAGAALKVTS